MSITKNFRYFFKFKQNFVQIHLMELCSGQYVLALVHRGFVFCDLPCYCVGATSAVGASLVVYVQVLVQYLSISDQNRHLFDWR